MLAKGYKISDSRKKFKRYSVQQNSIRKIPKAKKGWEPGSSGGGPTWQAQSPEFKPQHCLKKKEYHEQLHTHKFDKPKEMAQFLGRNNL
jgi:hypothetical protein